MRGAGFPQAVYFAEHWIRAVAEFLNVPAVKVSYTTYTGTHCFTVHFPSEPVLVNCPFD